MERLSFRISVALVPLLAASTTVAATLILTADKTVYSVGEEVVLSMGATSPGEVDNTIKGRLVYDPRAGLARCGHTSGSHFLCGVMDPISIRQRPWLL